MSDTLLIILGTLGIMAIFLIVWLMLRAGLRSDWEDEEIRRSLVRRERETRGVLITGVDFSKGGRWECPPKDDTTREYPAGKP